MMRIYAVLVATAACGAPAAEHHELSGSGGTPASPCTRLEGTVVDFDDGGAPIAGATVNVAEGPLDDRMSQVRNFARQPTITDEHGHFVYDPAPRVATELLVYSAEYIVRTKLTRPCGVVRIGVHAKAPTADVQVQPPQP